MAKRSLKLPYGRQSIDEADRAAVDQVLRDDWITQGPRIAAFEGALAGKVGASTGVAVSSGTAALHSACIAAGLGEGDEAVVPVLTFAATAAAVRLTGAEVRFVDIDPQTWCVSTTEVDAACSDKTKAILPVDFAGQPCDWDILTELARNSSAVLIADSAHALGAQYKGCPVGSLADMTCFSFHPVKAITSAEGGMTTTNSDVFGQALKRARNHGIVHDPAQFLNAKTEQESAEPWAYEVQEIGLNYRISDLQCALGLSQLSKLDAFIDRRRNLADRYSKNLSEFDLLRLPKVHEHVLSAWHLYVIQLNLPALSRSRLEIFEDLRSRGLGVQVHYKPLHLHPYYGARYGLKRGDFPVAEAYYDAAITLPLFPAMMDNNVDDVCQIVTDVLNASRR